MKNSMTFILMAALVLVFGTAWGQTNVFPGSGNVGIGTTTPTSKLEILKGSTIGSRWNPSGSCLKLTDGTVSLIADGNEIYTNNSMYLGAFDDFHFRNVTNSGVTELLTIKETGNVGIGTTSPSKKLTLDLGSSRNGIQINSDGNSIVYSDMTFNVKTLSRILAGDVQHWNVSHRKDGYFTGSTGSSLEFYGQKKGGGFIAPLSFKPNGDIVLASGKNAISGNVGIGTTTPTSKLEILKGSTIGSRWNPSGSYLKLTDGTVSLIADGNEIYTNNSMYLGAFDDFHFRNVTNTGVTELLTIKETGNVGIGTTAPQNKLDVCGTIRSKEILVETGWCDFVFAEDYKLNSLEEKDQFIQKNGHLPEFESAETMDGEIKIGDVTKRQQVSIEEITLHLIQLNKEIQALKAENASLRQEVEQMKLVTVKE